MATEIATVTPVADATSVQWDDRVSLTEGNVTIAFSSISRARTYQAALSPDCGASCPDGALHGFSVTLYSAEGEPEKDPRLISQARITVDVDADTVSELGGTAVLLQTYALGGVSLLSTSNGESDRFSENQFVLDIEPDGSAVVTAETRRIGGSWALALDADIVDHARAQLSGQPVETPTAIPTPTVAPVPTPTAEPEPVIITLPGTGDSSPPLFWMMTLAAAAILIALQGTRVIAAWAHQRRSPTPDDAPRMSDRWA